MFYFPTNVPFILILSTAQKDDFRSLPVIEETDSGLRFVGVSPSTIDALGVDVDLQT